MVSATDGHSVLTDSQLIEEIRLGNARKYALLVDRHKEKAFTLALRIVHSRQEAEEIVQDAFLRAFRSLSLFRGDSRFSTWLFRIVYNVSMTRVSRKKAMVDGGEELAVDTMADDPSIVERMEQEEVRATLLREIGKLSPNFRTAVTLFYFDDMSYKEMSEIMQVPLGTVKTYLFRARDVLRESMVEHREEQIDG